MIPDGLSIIPLLAGEVYNVSAIFHPAPKTFATDFTESRGFFGTIRANS
jgi:hypothetical protein